MHKYVFNQDQLTSLSEQFTGYAKETGWPDCPGLTVYYKYLTRVYHVKVEGTKISRAFTTKGMLEVVAGIRDPSYVIKDLQEQWTPS
jgi:hypothetical protein